jgi:hypothetical protein
MDQGTVGAWGSMWSGYQGLDQAQEVDMVPLLDWTEPPTALS